MHFPAKITYLTIIMIMIVMFGGVLLWMDKNNFDDFKKHHFHLATKSTSGVASQVSSFMQEQKRLVSVFAREYKELIQAIKSSPEDDNVLARLEAKVKLYFPNYFAFTVSDLNGDTYLVDYDGLVSGICVDDLKKFSKENQYSPYIHPNTEGYHFDVMTQFGEKRRPEGIFFISFHADILGNVLLNSTTPNHKLMLIYPEKKDLIEIVAEGARNKWIRDDYRMSENEQSRILVRTPVKGTRWQAIDIYESDLFERYQKDLFAQSSVVFTIFFAIGLLLVIRLYKEEKQRKDAEHQRETLLSYITHEFRTPLTTIMNALGLLDDKNNSNVLPLEKKQGLVEVSLKNVRQLRRLVDDFLEMRKLESHEFKLTIKKINLYETVNECVENNRFYAKQRNVNFELIPPKSNIFIRADANRICQVVSNFLSNAVKYGGENKEVGIFIELVANKAKVSVRDYGPGIPKTYIPNVFKQFAVGHVIGTSNVPSTGLGLSICKTIIEQHRGDIGYETKEGEGTTFYFILPLAR